MQTSGFLVPRKGKVAFGTTQRQLCAGTQSFRASPGGGGRLENDLYVLRFVNCGPFLVDLIACGFTDLLTEQTHDFTAHSQVTGLTLKMNLPLHDRFLLPPSLLSMRGRLGLISHHDYKLSFPKTEESQPIELHLWDPSVLAYCHVSLSLLFWACLHQL